MFTYHDICSRSFYFIYLFVVVVVGYRGGSHRQRHSKFLSSFCRFRYYIWYSAQGRLWAYLCSNVTGGGGWLIVPARVNEQFHSQIPVEGAQKMIEFFMHGPQSADCHSSGPPCAFQQKSVECQWRLSNKSRNHYKLLFLFFWQFAFTTARAQHDSRIVFIFGETTRNTH